VFERTTTVADWLGAGTGDDDFPPTAAMRLSIAALARRFAVSRVHVRRLLEGAAREGAIEIDLDGAVRFADAVRGEIRFLYAAQLAQLAQLLASAPGTLRVMREPDSRTGAGMKSPVHAESQNCPVAASVCER